MSTLVRATINPQRNFCNRFLRNCHYNLLRNQSIFYQGDPSNQIILNCSNTKVSSKILNRFYRTSTIFSNDSQKNNSHENPKNQQNFGSTIGIIGIGTLGSIILWLWNRKSDANLVHAAQLFPLTSQKKQQSEIVLPHLPTYKLSQVSEHYDPEKRVWVTFKRGVYDVTDFIPKHPGGDRILMGAGGSLEPFWELYPTHKREDILQMLEKYRIGNLAEGDLVKLDLDDKSHFQNEPIRHPALAVRSAKPFNAETPPELLTQKFCTPNEIFYTRNHLPVPKIDISNYTLEIDGLQGAEKILSWEDLQKFPEVSETVTIQCGGNRRAEMSVAGSVSGLSWTGGAIGTAKWTGVRLKDVLSQAGFSPENFKNPEQLHIQFEGSDADQSGEYYGSSIPFSYMLDSNFQPILAFKMNGKEIPIDHGYPVRLILPGIVGSRNVKWLRRIVISNEESNSPWQRRDYKVFSPGITMETVDFDSAPAIQDTPVTSYLCSHKTGDTVRNDKVTIEGYAYSGGGRKIVRVELSMDQGRTWWTTELTSAPSKPGQTKYWAWALWKSELDLRKFKDGDQVEIWVKSVDSGYNQQTENFSSIYNYRGLLANAFHKVKLRITTKS